MLIALVISYWIIGSSFSNECAHVLVRMHACVCVCMLQLVHIFKLIIHCSLVLSLFFPPVHFLSQSFWGKIKTGWFKCFAVVGILLYRWIMIEKYL